MDIPKRVSMRNTIHGRGAKGMSFYGYEDTGGLGIRMEARRENGRSPFVEKWFLDALPGVEFATFAALRESAAPLTDAEIEATTVGAYPLIKDVEPDACGNRCRLCPREGPSSDAQGQRIKHDTWRVVIAYSWKDVHSLSLCDEHLEKFQADPKGLKVAIEEEVATRKARAEKNLQRLQGAA